MPSMKPRRVTPVALATILLLVLAWTPISAAEGDGEVSLCDLLTLDELHGLSELRYAEPSFGSDMFCFYEASPDQAGPHSINLDYRELPFGMAVRDMRDALREGGSDIIDVTVGDLPAYIDATYPDSLGLVVGLEDRSLSIIVSIGSSAEAGGLDPSAYALELGEVLVPKLASASTAQEPPRTDGLAPPPIEGISWDIERELGGEQIRSESEEVELDLWSRLLDASGTGFDQASLLSATARDPETNERVGAYSAWRIVSADAAQLIPVLLEWLRGASGAEDFVATDAVVGGRGVTEVSFGGERRGLVHASGDTLIIIELPDGAAATALERLP